jgi:hypothetical protein
VGFLLGCINSGGHGHPLCSPSCRVPLRMPITASLTVHDPATVMARPTVNTAARNNRAIWVEDTPQHDQAAASLPLFDAGPAVVRVGLPLYGQLCRAVGRVVIMAAPTRWTTIPGLCTDRLYPQ